MRPAHKHKQHLRVLLLFRAKPAAWLPAAFRCAGSFGVHFSAVCFCCYLTRISIRQPLLLEAASNMQQEVVNPEVCIISKPRKPRERVVLNCPDCTVSNLESSCCVLPNRRRVWCVGVYNVEEQQVPVLLLLCLSAVVHGIRQAYITKDKLEYHCICCCCVSLTQYVQVSAELSSHPFSSLC